LKPVASISIQPAVLSRDLAGGCDDFETASRGRDSACSIGLVKVVNGEIVEKVVHLIRPPFEEFLFTHIHGLTWADVAEAPDFGELWSKIAPIFEGADFIAAHNASFDAGVLEACCDRFGLQAPDLPYRCTVQLARKTWALFPTKLSDVCRHLDIELNHHEALSDALACARIVLAAANSNLSRPNEFTSGSSVDAI
jgi:DNA polymerase-3 subunit epsilon